MKRMKLTAVSAENDTSRALRSTLPKLRQMSGREVCAVREANGFLLVRQKGSHRIMQKRLPDTTITIPVPDHRELRIGTLLSIIRQSSLPRSLFETE